MEDMQPCKPFIDDILDALLEGCQVIDFDWRYRYLNDAAVRQARREKSELLGHKMREIFPDIEATPMFKALEGCMAARTPAKIANQFTYPDGSTAWFELSIRPVPEGLLIASLDITEHKQTEDKVRKLNRVYAVLSDVNQAIVRMREPQALFEKVCEIAVQHGGFLLAWVGVLEEQTGCIKRVAGAGESEGFLDAMCLGLMDEDCQQRPLNRSILSGEKWVCNDLALNSPSLSWIEDALRLGARSLGIYPLQVSGELRAVFGLFSAEAGFFVADELKLLDELAMDLSFALESIQQEAGRKQALADLQDSQERYRTVADYTYDWEYWLAPDGKMLYCSPSCQRLTGHSAEEFYADPGLLEALVYPADRTLFAQHNSFTNLPDAQPGVHEIDFRLLQDNGEVRWIAHTCQAIFRPDGASLGRRATNRDVTQRKQAEQEIEILSRFPSENPNPVLRIRQDGVLLYANSPALQLVTALGGSVDTLLPQPWSEQVIQVFASGLNAEIEFKEGERIFSLFINPVVNVGYVNVYGRDVTQHRQAEQALAESESNYRRLFENASLAIFQVTTGGKLLSANPACARIFGYSSPAEILAQLANTADLYAVPQHRGEVLQRRLASAAQDTFENLYRRKDGSTFYGNLHLQSVTDSDGQVQYLEGFIEDITERKRAEEALRESEKHYRLISENSADVIWILDPASQRLSYISPSVARLRGFTPEEVMAQSMDQFLTPELFETVHKDMSTRLAAFAAGDELARVRVYQVGQPCKDGSVVSTEIMTTLVTDAQGQVIEILGVTRDDTFRQHAEEALRRSEERYRSLFNGMTEGFALHEILCDENGQPNDYRFLEINPAFESLTGLKQEQTVGKLLSQVLPDDDPKWVQIYGKVALSGQPVHFENYSPALKQYYEVFAYSPAPRQFAVLFMNVTERKRMEEQLRASEERFRSIYENATIGLYRTTPSGQVLMINPALLHMLGYTSLEELASRNLEEAGYEPGYTRQQFRQRIEGQGEVHDFESSWTRRDGSAIFVRESARAFRDASGQALYYEGTVEDITERRRVEEELRKSERMYRAIGESIDYGVWVCDADGRDIYTSPSFLKLVGFTQEECADFGWAEALHPDDAEKTTQTWQECVRTGATWDSEHRFLGVDGQWHAVLGRGMPVRDDKGNITSWVGINLDISGRKQAEEALQKVNDELELRVEQRTAQLQALNQDLQSEIAGRERVEAALRESEARFRAAANGSLDAFYILRSLRDAAGRITDFEFMDINPGGEKMVALPREAVIGQKLCELLPVNRKGGFFEKYVKVVESGQTLEEEFSLSDEHIHATWLQHMVVPLADGVAITSRDITERRRAEEAIRQLNQSLRRSAETLEIANKELEAFSYSVSHDLRAPLRAIHGFSRILLEEYQPQLPPEAQRYLDLVSQNTQQMGRLIDDLLAFSRLGRQSLRLQTVYPALLARQVLANLLPEQDERKIEIVIGSASSVSTDPDQALPACQADPALLAQVYTNLISNALKFTRRCPAARIEIGAQKTEEEVIYYVKDNGVGFDMQYAPKLFGVFQRLHSASEYEGTGVGLAIVQRIIQRHGGRVWAQAEQNQGAAFYFTLAGGSSNE